MRLIVASALAAALALAGCDAASGPDGADGAAEHLNADIPEAPASPAAKAPGEVKVGETAPPADNAGRPPQIAYVYDYGFRLVGEAIAPLEERHADLCESKGPNVCRIIKLDQSGAEGDYVHGRLELAVAANQAREFGRELAKVAADAHGEEVSSSIAGEDLSKSIVDTEARLRARTLLRDRLMEVLATRKGTVAELVEAERAVADVNEEIDQATSWLAEMRGRVAYSRVNVDYESGGPSAGGFLSPIRGALGSIGTILGTLLAAVILILVIGLPIIAIVLVTRFAWVRLRPPMRRLVSGKAEAAEAE